MYKERIEINFRQALMKAAELEQIADEMTQIVSGNVMNSIQALRYGWNSEHAKEYVTNYVFLCEEIQETIKDLQTTVNSIRTAAVVLYAAEIAAIQWMGDR